MFVAEKSWGFNIGFYKTNLTDLKRGDAVTINYSANTVERANNDTPKMNVYLVDYARTALMADQTPDEAENVPAGAYLTLHNISEGCYTLDQEHFTSKPAVGDTIAVTAAGKLQSSGSGILVAKVIWTEGTDTEYKVTISPTY